MAEAVRGEWLVNQRVRGFGRLKRPPPESKNRGTVGNPGNCVKIGWLPPALRGAGRGRSRLYP